MSEKLDIHMSEINEAAQKAWDDYQEQAVLFNKKLTDADRAAFIHGFNYGHLAGTKALLDKVDEILNKKKV